MTKRDASDLTTLIHGSAAVLPAASVSCTLTFIEGPDAGRSFPIDDVAMRRVLIGQSEACDIRVSDRLVSRRHAALEGDDGGVRIVDLGSRNGTRVGAVRIRDAYLVDGDIVRLGASAARFEVGDAPQVLAASEELCFRRFLGASPEMRRLYPRFALLASAKVPALIEGETGTGKEVLAESIHDASDRRRGPFVVFDCSSTSPQLVDAELFGHVRGAFTGAVDNRPGLFEEAHGGTIFIDEIGELALDLQSKLLRAIERSEVRRIGSNDWTKVDARVICATRRDLDQEVQARRFRDDLFFRLAVARVELPPLRRRQGDIAFLARAFWVALGGDVARLSPDMIQRFEAYSWPGNVRELHNAVARYLAIGDDDLGTREVDADRDAGPSSGADFFEKVIQTGKPLPIARQEVVLEFERVYLARALASHGGNVGAASAAMGIGRRYFQKLRAAHRNAT